jgi:hypothetical protein
VRLAKWQKNGVFEAIQKAGLRPEEFGWESGGEDDRLTHLASLGYFVFGGVAGKYRVRYASGDAPIAELEKYSWSALMTSVEVWLTAVKADREMPDLWGDLGRQREMLGPAPGETIENTPFAAWEQVEIGKQIREIQEYVRKSYALSEHELLALDERLVYIEEAAGRLGRIDWRNAVAGAMLGAIVAAAIPPEAVRALLNLLFQSIGHFFGQGLLPG